MQMLDTLATDMNTSSPVHSQSTDIPHLTSPNVQARELRAMATSLAFHQHYFFKQVMEAACWRVDSTFASFYFRDLTPAHLQELGPMRSETSFKL